MEEEKNKHKQKQKEEECPLCKVPEETIKKLKEIGKEKENRDKKK